MKPRDAATLTMAIGVMFLVRGAWGLFDGSGIEPVQSILGTLGLIGGGLWRLRM